MVRKSQRSQKAYLKKYYAKNKDKIQEAARVLGETKQDRNKEAYQAHQKSIQHSRRKRYLQLGEQEKEERYEESAEKEKKARSASNALEEIQARMQRYQSDSDKEKVARVQRYQSEKR